MGFNIFSFLPFTARVLKEDINGMNKGFDHGNNQFTENQEVKVIDDQTDELVSMDYTPANKNPPIHN